MTASVSVAAISQESVDLKPVLYLAADLGKSDCKFLYWTGSSEFIPIWLGSNLVEGVNDDVLRFFETGGELSESAWLQVGGQNILVGNSAASYQGSFLASKKETAAYRIATALGIAAIELGLSHYRAVVSVAIPLNEFQSREEIKAQLEDIGQGFVVCGRAQQFDLKLSFYPEGTGLYLLHKQAKQKQTASAYNRRLVVLMMGHRNLSMLVFDKGRLEPTLSQISDSLGFWESFKTDATKVHVREVDYPSLQLALFSGQPQQLSLAEGKRIDYSSAITAIRSGLMRRLEPFCRDVVSKLLISSTETDLLIGGGLGHLLRLELRDYFHELVPQTPVSFADEVGGSLLLLSGRSRGGEYDMARPMRFADVYGLAVLLNGQQRQPK